MRASFLITCVFLGFIGYGQQFGGIPASIKWKQIQTPQANIIFPEGLDKAAFSTANIIGYADSATAGTIGRKHRKINILFQNQTTISNGFVALAPWRSEFFMTPQLNSFQLGSLPWVKSLALHEYRHVQQYMNFRKGLSKVAYYLLGEEGQALANSASIPDWFFEGDAILQETLLSGQGRGRVPAFFNGYRSLWQDQKRYSYMKLRNGSMKNFVPDHYALGYLLTGYGREKYGDDFWANVTDDAARFKGIFYPFQKAVKRHGGIGFKQFAKNALAYYEEYPVVNHPAPEKAMPDFITPATPRYVSNYTMPYAAGGDSILVMKRTYRDIPAWYWLTNGQEYKIRTKDIGLDDYYSYRNGKIVYTAYEPDTRWGQRNFSVIKILDVYTGAVSTLKHKTKYFSPDISEDGTSVVAIQYLPDQSTALHLLDAQNGTVLHEIPVTDAGLTYTYPKFYDDKNLVVCVRDKDGLMAVALVDITTGALDNLTAWSFDIKGYPAIKNDTVYFSASKGYYDNIYAVDIKSKQVHQLTTESMSAYQPAINQNGKLIWASFTANGYRLKEKVLANDDWQPLMSTAVIQTTDLYLPAVLQKGGDVLSTISDSTYPVKKYRKITAPFNFHSWRPYYAQPEWSATLYGQNLLNTFRSTLQYVYNENESSHRTDFDAMLGAWYPWLTANVSYTINRNAVSSNRHIFWNELNAGAGVQLPLNFTSGRWYKNLTLASNFNVLQQSITGAYKDSIQTSMLQYLQASVNWSSQIQTAVQQINPRLAQSFFVRYRQSVSAHTANQLLASGSLYLPGITKTNSLVLTGAYQQRDTANRYRFGNSFPFARGYQHIESPQMFKWGINYHFPLLYPDWGFGNLVYFQRIRANLFFDYAYVSNTALRDMNAYRSMGTELFFDTKWWNQQPASFGFRYSYLPDFRAGQTTAHRIEFVLPVNLISP